MNEVIIYLLKVIVIQGLLYLFYRFILRNTGHHVFNRGYLLISMIVAFAIPVTKISLPESIPSSEEVAVIMWLSEPVSDITEFDLIPVTKGSSDSYWYLLPWFYGIIASIFIIRSVFYLTLLIRLKRRAEFEERRWYKLFKISQDRPFSFFSNVFMPKSLFGTESFDQILTHECEHVRQHHSIDRLLMDFIVSLFWFNPFIYLYRNALIEIHEFQADEVVLDRFNDPVGYQEILFSQLQSRQYSGLVSHFNFSMIKKRIVMMNKQNKMSGWVYLLTAPVMLTIVFAFSSKEAMVPINVVGDEIAAILGPENELDFSSLGFIEHENSANSGINEPNGEMQENIPEILPLKDVKNVRLTSGYGMRMHPIYKVKKMHLGSDFSCPIGSKIIAPADGKVKKVEAKKEGYGNILTLDHGGGIETRFAQLSEFKVKEGDMVNKGDVIALSGNSGASTAPHLHYEVKKNGEFVDPASYINDYDFRPRIKEIPSDSKSDKSRIEEAQEKEMLLANQERELAEQSRQKALKEVNVAHEEMLRAEKEAALAQLESEKNQEMRISVRALEESKKAEEKKLTEVQLLASRLESSENNSIDFSNEDQKPLFVLNGDVTDNVKDLKPDDIESITVLKGANAFEKYGSDGEDGVIEIITKGKRKSKDKNKTKDKSKDKSEKGSKSAFKVMIDPGHGGKDSGAIAQNETEEKKITLEVSKLVANYFKGRNDVEVILTREGDSFKDLKGRATSTSNCDLFVSIHADFDEDKNQKFMSVFVSPDNKYLNESLSISQYFGNEFSNLNRENRLGLADLFLMKTVECPAIHVSLGHLSNKEDAAYLNSMNGKSELAKGIARAIEESLITG